MGEATAIIAGVGSGLGEAVARKFHREGCRVGLLARSEDYLDRVASSMGRDRNVLAIPTDLTDADQIAAAFGKVDSDLGGLDTLVYNAGYADWKGLLNGDADEFRKCWEVTVHGAYHCCREAGPRMVDKRGGAILFTGATSSVRGRGKAVGFSSAKFALRGMAQSLAIELWPKGIHVAHMIIDGMIDTPEVREKMQPKPDEPLLKPDEIAESYWMVAQQPRTAWSWEIDLRPCDEEFFV